GHHDLRLSDAGGSDREDALRAVGIEHGLQPIEDHVQDHLLDLDAITADPGQARGKLDCHRDLPKHYVVPDEVSDFGDDVVDVEGQVREIALAEQRAQSMNHVGRALVVGDDVGEDFAQGGEV